jgi:hypothetical protein
VDGLDEPGHDDEGSRRGRKKLANSYRYKSQIVAAAIRLQPPQSKGDAR